MNDPTAAMPSEAGRPQGLGAFGCVAKAWREHEGELRGYVRHRLSDDDAVDDLLQDVFVKAMRQGEGFCSLDNPRAWLFHVARNALVDRARTAHPTVALPEGVDEPAAPQAESPDPVDALTACLVRALDELSPEDAHILRACDLQASTLRAYADAEGLGLPAAKSRLLRARRRLRDHITIACQVSFESDGHVVDHVPRPASD
jgi:RNA polymerase sigma-70 factor (ECF subfamily)